MNKEINNKPPQHTQPPGEEPSINIASPEQAKTTSAKAKNLKQLQIEVLERTAELKDSRSLLKATLDSSLEMIQVFKAVRDEQGQIVDFIWVLNNASSEAVYGDVIGKSLLQNNPGVLHEGVFEKFVSVVETGLPIQYEQRYMHEQFNGWFYQSAVKLDDGVATSTLDITEIRNAEEKLRTMEANRQQEIFRVTLSTQEEERKRISESLHNGVGQLLYGIMISLSNLTTDIALNDPDAYKKNKQYTDKLLAQAIHESRRISHELMPSVLEHFGLSAAVEDICKQFSNSIKLNCSISLDSVKLDRYLELAIFRITQELTTNIVKHAQATTALVRISINANRICLMVKDNGIGMTKPLDGQHRGIGLASIRSKISLLNGTINIDSKKGTGTRIAIDIPIM